jgi:hypothetical protein
VGFWLIASSNSGPEDHSALDVHEGIEFALQFVGAALLVAKPRGL